MHPIPKPKLVTAPATLAVSLADLKTFLRVDSNLEDAQITLMAKAAITRIEKYIDQKLISQTWDVAFNDFPGFKQGLDQYGEREGVIDGSIADLRGSYGKLSMPFGPFLSLTSFKTYDNEDNEFLFPADQYQVDLFGKRGSVGLRIGAVWPTTVLRPSNGVILRGVFGYGPSVSDVPEEIQQAIMLFVSKLYENRGDVASDESTQAGTYTMPNTAMMLLEPYRKIKV